MLTERRALAATLTAALSAQIGAAIGGAALFPLIGPVGTVALRQAVAAVVLLSAARPPLHRLGWRALRPGLLLGLTIVVMNVGLYVAIDRVGLGLAVTLEFLGPLALALAASRRRLDLGLALVAGAGVVLLTGTVPGIDPVGIGFGLLSAGAWAAYILLNQRAGRALPGLQGTAVASGVAAVVSAPLLVVVLSGVEPGRLVVVLLLGLVVGVLCSAVPFSLDLLALRRLPHHLFGVAQSVHPALAAICGLLILGQQIAPLQLAGIALICASNVVAIVRTARPPRGGRGPQLEASDAQIVST